MIPTEHSIKVDRTARYYTLGNWDGAAARLFIVVHGYGQLAGDFIQQFEALADGKTAVMAPEALSRYYPKATNPAVGASWMTRIDRVNEINDYIAYLDKIYNAAVAQLPNVTDIHILGFSQGTSTVSRWVARSQPKCSHVWLFAGDVPDDLDYDGLRKLLQHTQLHLLLGKDDRIIPIEKAEPVKQRLADLNINYDLHVFDGDHIVDVALLKQLVG